MKIAASRADVFAVNPDAKAVAVLVYGPDGGLVRERALALVCSAVSDPADPFQVVEVEAEALRRDPARLADEAAAIPFGGGRRVVRVRDATDGVAPALESLLVGSASGPAGQALVVVEAGELPPRSALRRLFEDAPNAASLPCYLDEGADLVSTIRGLLADENVAAADDVLGFLAAKLGGDRAVTRSEIAKLALYVGAGGKATLEDAALCVGDSAALSLEDVAFAAGAADLAGLDRALGRVLQEGVAPVAVIRAVSRHFERMHLVAARMAEGDSFESAIAALRPPLFFKFRSAFRAQLRRWPMDRIAAAFEELLSLESTCKTTGMPAETICRQGLLLLAANMQPA
ncbi:MAG: DNA polymerase III subunit delta [Alphaproteobacteria bacterium]